MLPAEHPSGDWRARAICAQVQSKDIWFSTELGDISTAQSICMDCPVRLPCLSDGLDDEHGVWGGYTPSERARLVKYLPTDAQQRDLTLTRAAYVGPALYGVADRTHPLR